MLSKDWSVKTEEEGMCVHVHINPDISLEGLEFILMDENRFILVKMKVTCYEIYLCSNMSKPSFAKLGDCVKYVDGSGFETYS